MTVLGFVYVTTIVAAYIFFTLWRREKDKRDMEEGENSRLKEEVLAHETRQQIEDDVAMGDMPVVSGVLDPNQRD